MHKRYLKKLGLILALTIFLGTGMLLLGWYRLERQVRGGFVPVQDVYAVSFSGLQYLGERSTGFDPLSRQVYGFSDSLFANNELTKGALVRWFWPLPGMQNMDASSELCLLKEAGFGGAEIIPIWTGSIPPNQEQQSRTWFSTAINKLSEDAAANDFSLSINLSRIGIWSGAKQDDSYRSPGVLSYGVNRISGGSPQVFDLPEARVPSILYFQTLLTSASDVGSSRLSFDPHGTLEMLLAAKITRGSPRSNWTDLVEGMYIDSSSILRLEDKITPSGKLLWNPPEGNWTILAIRTHRMGQQRYRSDGELESVPDPLDGEDMDSWLQSMAEGMPPGSALLQPEIPFLADQLFHEELPEVFYDQAGYSLDSFLPLLLLPGGSHGWYDERHIHSTARFIFGKEDWRLREDFAAAQTAMWMEGYFGAGKRFWEQGGNPVMTVLSGQKTDLLKAAGHCQLPVADQGYADGHRAYLKLVSSGAAQNRQALVYGMVQSPEEGKLLTPLERKDLMDRLLIHGVNSLIGGTYTSPGALSGEAALTHEPGDFPLEVSPLNAYWEDTRILNQYLARAQYLMQLGEMASDVLMYYPYRGFPPAYGDRARNEGELATKLPFYLRAVTEAADDPRSLWLDKALPVIEKLEARGLSWEWVNAEGLESLESDYRGRIRLNGRLFASLWIIEAPYINVTGAEKLLELRKAEAKVWLYGKLPQKHPGFKSWEAADLRIHELMKALCLSSHFESLEALSDALPTLNSPHGISFTEPLNGMQIHKRQIAGGNIIVMLRNDLDAERLLSLQVDEQFERWYWLDAEDGKVYAAQPDEFGNLNLSLPSSSSIFLFGERAETEAVIATSDGLPFFPKPAPSELLRIDTIRDWSLLFIGPGSKKSEKINELHSLKAWTELSPSGADADEGRYSGTFQSQATAGERIFLRIGGIVPVADVSINTTHVSRLAWPPYVVDITDALLPGKNTIEIWLSSGKIHGHAVVPGTGLYGPVELIRVSDQRFMQFADLPPTNH